MRVKTWVDSVLIAEYQNVVLCESPINGKLRVGVTFWAEDETPFAHCHLALEEAESFLVQYAQAVQKVREELGLKPN